MRPHFRFEDLEIWQLARTLAVDLHKLANELDRKRLYRYAGTTEGRRPISDEQYLRRFRKHTQTRIHSVLEHRAKVSF
jgi:hypothetical protein